MIYIDLSALHYFFLVGFCFPHSQCIVGYPTWLPAKEVSCWSYSFVDFDYLSQYSDKILDNLSEG